MTHNKFTKKILFKDKIINTFKNMAHLNNKEANLQMKQL